MTSWTPQAVLANISLRTAIEAAPAAFVPPSDARVEAVGAIHPIHADFLGRFTDAFGERVHPTVLILESDAVASYSRAAAMASIRDILSISIVPRARARHVLHKGGSRVFYSKSFDFYPWMVSRSNRAPRCQNTRPDGPARRQVLRGPIRTGSRCGSCLAA